MREALEALAAEIDGSVVSMGEKEAGTAEAKIGAACRKVPAFVRRFLDAAEAGDARALVTLAREVQAVCGEIVAAANELSAGSADRSDQEKTISAAVRARKAGLDIKLVTAVLATTARGASDRTKTEDNVVRAFTDLAGAISSICECASFADLDWNTV